MRFGVLHICALACLWLIAMADVSVAAPITPRALAPNQGLIQDVQLFRPFESAPRRRSGRSRWTQPSRGARRSVPGQPSAAAPSAPRLPAGPVASQFTKTPAIEDKTRVVVFGDSMAVGLADGLAGIMTEEKGFQVQRMSRTNSGIVRKDYYDWADEITRAIEGQRINIAILMIGINDRQAIQLDGQSFELKTPRWTEVYRSRVDELIKILQNHGAAVYWTGLPIMRANRYSQDIAFLNNTVRERAGLTGAPFIDVWDAFATAEGEYSKDGPDLTGQRRTMRRSDGIHLTNAGNAKLGHFVDQVIRRDISVAGVDGKRLIIQSRSGGLVVSGMGAGATDKELAGANPGGQAGEGLGGPAVALSTLGSGAKNDGEATVSPLFQVLMRGESLEPKPGRADDFAWPRK